MSVYTIKDIKYFFKKSQVSKCDFLVNKRLSFVVVIFCSIIKSIDSWLKSDPNHVVVVHCKVCYFKQFFLNLHAIFL